MSIEPILSLVLESYIKHLVKEKKPSSYLKKIVRLDIKIRLKEKS